MYFNTKIIIKSNYNHTPRKDKSFHNLMPTS